MSVHATDIAPTLCPYCGYLHDAASEALGGDATPKVGDVSICLSCGRAGIFEVGLRIRKITDEEIAKMDAEQRRILLLAWMHCLARGPLTGQETRQ